MIAVSGEVWVSPAQWGSKLYFAFLMACLGGMVIHRAMRSDVSYAFLLSYVAILAARAVWLGDPWAIPIKQLQSGALLLFTFFMISDPKTTPDSRAGRVLFRRVDRSRRRLRPVRSLSHQWFTLVAGALLAAHPAH